ncbi:MAG: 1-acyl-sn-glycerol-3-phosphate acyltransferase, partial [Acidobacteriota bacterium]|nr:1-acyl-sn-glycerol-3-phosphate acyltransferase [Acidobacteriota bacterium]
MPPPATQPTHTPTQATPAHHIPRSARLYSRLIAIPLMALSTAVFGTVALLVSLWDTAGRRQHAVARAWAQLFLRIARSPVTVVHAHNFDPELTAVYACNHLSYMDTPTLFATIPFQFRILAKHDLWQIPFVGWYLKRSGQVPIDQGSPRSAIAGLLRGVATLKAGLPLFVFPEGSRTHDGRLQPAASGAAFMAIRAGVPLVPLALVGTYELLPIHTYSLSPRPLKLIVGPPIPTTGLTTRDAEALTTQLFDTIANLYYPHHPDDLLPTA